MLFNTILFLLSLAVTMLAMPLAHILGRRMNAWDRPDQLGNSSHKFQIVRTGGIAIAGGIYAGMMAGIIFSPQIFATRSMVAMMAGGALAFVTGLLDDLHEVRPWAKAVLLLIACLITVMISQSVRLTGFERLDFLLSVLILMGMANSFNLVDGLDGLASGMAISACLGLLALSVRHSTPFDGSPNFILLGAAAGFLFFNRPPARIFMGDCGSLLIGFYLGGMGLAAAGCCRQAIMPVLLVLSPFILDTGLAIVRRILSRKDIFTGDRKHGYDLLYLKFNRVWPVNRIMWGIGLGFSALGYAAVFLAPGWQAAVLAASWLGFILWMAWLGMFAPLGEAGEQKIKNQRSKSKKTL